MYPGDSVPYNGFKKHICELRLSKIDKIPKAGTLAIVLENALLLLDSGSGNVAARVRTPLSYPCHYPI